MKQVFKRFCALFMTICFVFVYSISTLAEEIKNSDNVEYVQKVSFWHWLLANPDKPADKSSILYGFLGYSLGEVCPVSEDGRHRSSTAVIVPDVLGTEHYNCTCDYCGDFFTVYDEDLSQSYESQVSELPATEITSEGTLIWDSFSAFDGTGKYYYGSSSSKSFSSLPLFLPSSSELKMLYELASSGDHIICKVFNYTFSSGIQGGIRLSFLCPVSGSYRSLPYTSYSFSLLLSSGEVFQSSSKPSNLGSYYHYNANDELPSLCLLYGQTLRELYGSSVSSLSISSGELHLYFPTYEIIPDSFVLDTSDEYSPNTRPSSISEINYGIMGDDGKISIVNDNSSIVNETNNTYYNPATGQTSPITNWSYDYTDRSYTITKEDCSTSIVTYGDENITIKEGDTVYNIYYMTDGSGSEPPPSSCDHTWVESSRTEPTCTVPGSIKSTCSKCGETKTEPIPVIDHTWTASDRTEPTCTVPGSQKSICSQCSQTKTDPIPALGHAWTAVRTVPTQYDENGTLTQEGYTLYECSRCKEQYKSTDGTGPPGGTGSEGENGDSIWDKLGNFLGSLFGGLTDLVGAALGKLLDALTALAAMLLEKLAAVVETVLSILDEAPKLFSGFLDFLALLFPYLPPEITLLLTFGVVAVVFAAIIKAIRS